MCVGDRKGCEARFCPSRAVNFPGVIGGAI